METAETREITRTKEIVVSHKPRVVSYNPREIMEHLEQRGRNPFTEFDLADRFGDLSIAAWVVHDLFLLGVVEDTHRCEYRGGLPYHSCQLPYRSFRFPDKDPESLPEKREAIFMRRG